MYSAITAVLAGLPPWLAILFVVGCSLAAAAAVERVGVRLLRRLSRRTGRKLDVTISDGTEPLAPQQPEPAIGPRFGR